eukprot:s488_g26.t1
MERDLHRWLRGLYNFRLQAYTIYLNLQVSGKTPKRTPVKVVRQEVNDTIARLTAWSLSVAAEGIAPQVGFHDEAFEKGSYRFAMRGKDAPPSMHYKNFSDSKAWPLTVLSRQAYLHFDQFSLTPWRAVPGLNNA